MAADSLRSSPVPGLRDDDHVRGDGPLVFAYADFSCPRCAVAWERLSVAPVRLVLRHLALKAKHPRALALAHAVEAAGLQGHFWTLAEALYADQGHIDDPHLWDHLEGMGVDLERWDADRRSDEVTDRVRRDVRDALRGGATATPTLFAAGRVLAGPPDAAWLASVSEAPGS